MKHKYTPQAGLVKIIHQGHLKLWPLILGLCLLISVKCSYDTVPSKTSAANIKQLRRRAVSDDPAQRIKLIQELVITEIDIDGVTHRF